MASSTFTYDEYHAVPITYSTGTSTLVGECEWIDMSTGEWEWIGPQWKWPSGQTWTINPLPPTRWQRFVSSLARARVKIFRV